MSRRLPALFGLDPEAYEKAIRADMFCGLELPEVTKEYFFQAAEQPEGERERTLDRKIHLHQADGPDRLIRLFVYAYEEKTEGAGRREDKNTGQQSRIYCLHFVDLTQEEKDREQAEFDVKRRIRAAELRAEEARKRAEEAGAEAKRQVREAGEYAAERLSEMEEAHAAALEALRRQEESRTEEETRRRAALEQRIEELQSRQKALNAEKEETLRQLGESKRETEQERQERTAFLGRLHGTLRWPPEAILALSDRMDASGEEESLRELTEKVREAAFSMRQQVDRLLEIAALETREREKQEEPFVFPELMNRLTERVSDACDAAGIEFEASIDKAIPELLVGDRAAIERILGALLDNAVKFTGDGGRVRFLAERGIPQDGAAALRFSVIDTGIGIPEALMPVLFDPFVKGETMDGTNDGFGLGLAVADRLVRSLGGGIGVSSTPGVGSYFTVDLTLRPVTAESGRVRTAR